MVRATVYIDRCGYMAKLEAEIAQLIRRYEAQTGKRLTVATVESATGGKIADRLTDIPGSSDYFKGSIVSYSNEVKIDIVGVKKETIDSFGVVSSQTALEMARGGKALLGADICVSDTGIAGPSGATPGKPVGLFYTGLAAEDASLTEEHMFSGDRDSNKREATEAALNMLKQHLLRLCLGKGQ